MSKYIGSLVDSGADLILRGDKHSGVWTGILVPLAQLYLQIRTDEFG
ncbi:MAG: hypothetical protein KTR24_09485 [Saprospiraceae bacterium]|nr:hypothetical protein [Saprospiraceae bacterium]